MALRSSDQISLPPGVPATRSLPKAPDGGRYARRAQRTFFMQKIFGSYGAVRGRRGGGATGAGHAFVGGFAAALAGGVAPLDAARFGSAAGGVSVTRPGDVPAMLHHAGIEVLLRGAVAVMMGNDPISHVRSYWR
jgi:pfkB family carbohydrate kinase